MNRRDRIADWLACKFLDVMWALFPKSKNPEPLVPWMEVEHREYEWDAELHCSDCEGKTTHRLVEWIDVDPSRVTTAKCLRCDGPELVFDIKEAR